MKVIGITGTKGKTTTSYMVASILEKAHKKVGIIGTIGSIVNGEFRKTKNTTPESFELQKLMHEMVEAGCEYCVMEVSSQGLKMCIRDRMLTIGKDLKKKRLSVAKG